MPMERYGRNEGDFGDSHVTLRATQESLGCWSTDMVAAVCPAVWGKAGVPLPNISMGEPRSVSGSRRVGCSSGFPQMETAKGMGTGSTWEQGKAGFKQQHLGGKESCSKKGSSHPWD